MGAAGTSERDAGWTRPNRARWRSLSSTSGACVGVFHKGIPPGGGGGGGGGNLKRVGSLLSFSFLSASMSVDLLLVDVFFLVFALLAKVGLVRYVQRF